MHQGDVLRTADPWNDDGTVWNPVDGQVAQRTLQQISDKVRGIPFETYFSFFGVSKGRWLALVGLRTQSTSTVNFSFVHCETFDLRVDAVDRVDAPSIGRAQGICII